MLSFRWVLAVVSGVVDFAMVSVYLETSDVETSIFVEATGDDGVVNEAALNGDACEVKGAQDKRFDGCYLTQPDCFRRAAHNFIVADAYQIGLHNLRLWVVSPCLRAALLVPRVSCVSWSASTLASKRVACALAGLEGRITSLEMRWWFFLFGVGLFFVLSRPGYFSEALAGGVLSGAWGWSLRFFARVARALATRGTARAAMFAAAFTSLSIAPCSGQTDSLWVGWVTRWPHM